MKFRLRCASRGVATAYKKDVSKFIVETNLNKYDEEEIIVEIKTLEELNELREIVIMPLILYLGGDICIYDDYL